VTCTRGKGDLMTRMFLATLIMLSVCLIGPANAAARRERAPNPYYGSTYQAYGDYSPLYGPPAYCYASPEPAFCPAPRPVSGYAVH